MAWIRVENLRGETIYLSAAHLRQIGPREPGTAAVPGVFPVWLDGGILLKLPDTAGNRAALGLPEST